MAKPLAIVLGVVLLIIGVGSRHGFLTLASRRVSDRWSALEAGHHLILRGVQDVS